MAINGISRKRHVKRVNDLRISEHKTYTSIAFKLEEAYRKYEHLLREVEMVVESYEKVLTEMRHLEFLERKALKKEFRAELKSSAIR